jgi:hypothetical protein
LESKLQCQFNFKTPILRKFSSVEEQNNWFSTSDKESILSLLSTTLISKKGIQPLILLLDMEVLHLSYIGTNYY